MVKASTTNQKSYNEKGNFIMNTQMKTKSVPKTFPRGKTSQYTISTVLVSSMLLPSFITAFIKYI